MSSRKEDFRGLWEYFRKMSEIDNPRILKEMLCRLEWLQSKQTYQEYRELLREKRIANQKKWWEDYKNEMIPMTTQEYRTLLYPAARILTKWHKFAIENKTHDIYRFTGMRPNDGLWVNSVGPFGACVEEYRGYPLMLMATLRIFKYYRQDSDGKFLALDYEPTRKQWDRLYRTCSLFKTIDFHR